LRIPQEKLADTSTGLGQAISKSIEPWFVPVLMRAFSCGQTMLLSGMQCRFGHSGSLAGT